jgi:NAD(P)-dependent dehydrogenase (short-subunit alcohol dehydrogenase family)
VELSGQVAIVTGAGRGIGRATALELAQMGADIVVAEMDRDGAERTEPEHAASRLQPHDTRTNASPHACLLISESSKQSNCKEHLGRKNPG